MVLRGEVVSGLDDVERDAWDALVGPEGFYSSYDWLRSQEASPAAAASYALVHDGPRLVAATPLYDFAGWASPAVLAPGEGGDQWFGPRTGFRQSLLVRPGDGAGERVRELVVLAGREAEARGRGRLVLAHLGARDVRLLASADLAASLRLTSADAILENPAGTFEGYVRALGSRRRSRRATEWLRFRELGLTVRTASLVDCVEETASLIALTESKYDTPITEDDIRSYLREQARCVGDRSVVFRCLDADGSLLGVSVCFVRGRFLLARVAGFRYERLRDAFEYFNTAYYEPLRYMEAHGLDRLHLGVEAWGAKVRRGATLRPLFTATVALPATRGALRRADPAADESVRAGLHDEANGGMSDADWGADALAEVLRPGDGTQEAGAAAGPAAPQPPSAGSGTGQTTGQ